MSCLITAGLPPSRLVSSAASKPANAPASSKRMLLAYMRCTGTRSTSATGSIICLNPPDTRYTALPLWCSLSTSSFTPGVSLTGFFAKYACRSALEGWIRSRRAARAFWNNTSPPIALAVHAATASPAPLNAASWSMPSSGITVLSTSKQTAWQVLMIFAISSRDSFSTAVLCELTEKCLSILPDVICRAGRFIKQRSSSAIPNTTIDSPVIFSVR
mmetsp:Transcript_3649/g.8260  ORF Transcript_3649/g.8260 Transcript_3649/m.8260 type:complete len:216 (+) Transcript_3649:2-649(+)